MNKRIVVGLFSLLLCCGLLLTLAACVGQSPKETPAPSDDPPSVEIDGVDVDDVSDGDYSGDIVVTPKDPDMNVVISPKDPNTNMTILPGNGTHTSTPAETASPTPTVKPTPAPSPTPKSTSTPAPTATPAPATVPTTPPNIDTSDTDVDIEADAKGSADFSLEDLIGGSSNADTQDTSDSVWIGDGESAQIDDVVVTSKGSGEDVVVTSRE